MSDLVGNPEDRFSHNEAHIYLHFSQNKRCLSVPATDGPQSFEVSKARFFNYQNSDPRD